MPRSLWVFRIDRDNGSFLATELFDHHRLRQGWGIPTTDLRQNEAVWIESYISQWHVCWNTEISPAEASERRHILMQLLGMRIGDVIILPNVGRYSIDEEKFTLATVAGNYDFQIMQNQPIQDYGHIIPVSDLRAYDFSHKTLPRRLFGAPFMHCIDQVQTYWQAFAAIDGFIQSIDY